jgi:hypothetical protein
VKSPAVILGTYLENWYFRDQDFLVFFSGVSVSDKLMGPNAVVIPVILVAHQFINPRRRSFLYLGFGGIGSIHGSGCS